MSVEDLTNPEIVIELQGENRKVEFKLRNFAALKRIYGITEGQLLKGLIQGDTGILPYAIWCGTLKFAPFDAADPLKIETQADLEQLFNLNLTEIKDITDKVVKAIEAYLPKPPEGGAEKKQKTENT